MISTARLRGSRRRALRARRCSSRAGDAPPAFRCRAAARCRSTSRAIRVRSGWRARLRWIADLGVEFVCGGGEALGERGVHGVVAFEDEARHFVFAAGLQLWRDLEQALTAPEAEDHALILRAD